MRKFLHRGLWVAAVLGAVAVSASSAGAAPDLFGGATSTAGGYHTYDSDQINVEGVSQTGKGVYVAVLDTGLVPNYRDYFPEQRVAAHLGTGFEQQITFKNSSTDPCGVEAEVGQMRESSWVGSSSTTHGSHVASTILGYYYDANADTAGGYSLPPLVVRGIAPDVTVIPVKVLADYQMPSRPACTDPDENTASHTVNFGTDAMVSAGINYVTSLAKQGYRPMVINMSLGGDELADIEKQAIDNAIKAGVIIVAAAGNAGEDGMHFPGAYAPVISAGASGWTREFMRPDAATPATSPHYRLWWLKAQLGNMVPGSGEVADPSSANDVIVANFSSREYSGQDLDVLAPGNWVRGPFGGNPGYSHLPWWSKGIGDIVGNNPGNFYYVGGTSMASPHVAAAASMLLQKNPRLSQSQVESILESTALTLPSKGNVQVRTILATGPGLEFAQWDTQCTDSDGVKHRCDPVGSGLLQVDRAIAATP